MLAPQGPISVRRHDGSLAVMLLLFAALLALAAPAAARQKPAARPYDLKIRPGDVAVPGRPPQVARLLPRPVPRPEGRTWSEAVEHADRVVRPDIPKRHEGDAEDGGDLLDEMLEGKMIPLIRVTMPLSL